MKEKNAYKIAMAALMLGVITLVLQVFTILS